MAIEERFEHIERSLAAVVAAQRIQAESQTKLTESLIELTQRISRYVDSADERMKRIEENLDGLIRAITAEHSNGKARQK